jgi:hypothetical protein
MPRHYQKRLPPGPRSESPDGVKPAQSQTHESVTRPGLEAICPSACAFVSALGNRLRNGERDAGPDAADIGEVLRRITDSLVELHRYLFDSAQWDNLEHGKDECVKMAPDTMRLFQAFSREQN